MKGLTIQTNETKNNPFEIEAKLTADTMDIDEALLHLATAMQALGQSIGNISQQLKKMKPVQEENASQPIESLPNDK